jgi:TolB protein
MYRIDGAPVAGPGATAGQARRDPMTRHDATPRTRRGFALFAALFAAVLPATGLAAATPAPSAASPPAASLAGRIAFSDETNDVWTVDADGTGLRRLTTDPAHDFDPSWSPDGRRIAFRSDRDGNNEIYVMDADGSHQTNLTKTPDEDEWGPAWSPDGTGIAFNSSRGTHHTAMRLYLMKTDGSDVTPLGDVYAEYPAWSPDGTKIAFMSQEPGAAGNNPNYNIYLMNADGSGVRRLTETQGEDGWPSWSPDGQHIAFASARDDCSVSDQPDCKRSGDIGPVFELWIMDADGGNQRRLSDAFAQFCAWSPDGRAVLATGGPGDPFLLSAEGSELGPLPIRGVGQPLFPDWIR